jgi:RNA polymerase II C-terminal domain phosphatase-like 3/4
LGSSDEDAAEPGEVASAAEQDDAEDADMELCFIPLDDEEEQQQGREEEPLALQEGLPAQQPRTPESPEAAAAAPPNWGLRRAGLELPDQEPLPPGLAEPAALQSLWAGQPDGTARRAAVQQDGSHAGANGSPDAFEEDWMALDDDMAVPDLAPEDDSALDAGVRALLRQNKLCLVLDLDHTLLNSARLGEVEAHHTEVITV